ncbi:hypothetical protein [Rhabdochromatium marinum]|uniref:hypothetical protein n=1 Tax=Rhabdochromatium marinum TaxID=48729 RepID=UPI0019081A9D|nr:hypothetical protein [Rhabdochromatium marinum]
MIDGKGFRFLVSVLSLTLAWSALCVCAQESSVYRCTAADGSIEFRQYPCHGRDASVLLDIDQRPSGWTPPDPAEVFDAEDEAEAAAERSQAAAKARAEAAKAAAVERRQEEKCWKKHHQLEQVERKLRAGYQASEGQRLRHKRTEYEDYLKRFCD